MPTLEQVVREAKEEGNFDPLFLYLDSNIISLSAAEVDELLRAACRCGDLRAVEYLVKFRDANVSSQDDNFVTPLHIACFMNHAKIVRFLLDEGARIDDVIATNRNTPIIIACMNGYLDIFKILLEPQYRPLSGNPLKHATEEGRNLTSLVADLPNKKDFLEIIIPASKPATTAVEVAIPTTERTSATTFLDLPADVLVVICKLLNPQEIITLLKVCRLTKQYIAEEIYSLDWHERRLRDYPGQKIPAKYYQNEPFKLYAYARIKAYQSEGQVSPDPKLVRNFHDLARRNSNVSEYAQYFTLYMNLYQSITLKNSLKLDFLHYLYKNSSNLNEVLNYIFHAFAISDEAHLLTAEGMYVINCRQPIKLLEDLCLRAQRMQMGWVYIDSFFKEAAEHGTPEALRTVIEFAKKFPEITIDEYQRKFCTAVRFNTPQAVQVFLDEKIGLTPEIVSYGLLNGYLALFQDSLPLVWSAEDLIPILDQAILNHQFDVIKTLIERGCLRLIPEVHLYQLIEQAIQFGNLPILNAFLDGFIKLPLLLQNDVTRRPYLNLVLEEATEEMAIAFIHKSLLVSQPDALGRTPLMIAAARGFVQAFSIMLERNFPLGEVDNKGESALMYAVAAGQTDIVRIILANVADPLQELQRVNTSGETAYVKAQNINNQELQELLNPANFESTLNPHSAKYRCVAGGL